MKKPMGTLVLLVMAAVIAPCGLAAESAQQVPTIDQMIEVKRLGATAISPDGRLVAYTIRETDWEENGFDTEIWIGDTETGGVRQLTRGKKSSLSPAWSPDGRRLAFISDRSDKRQIYLIDPTGGEAQPLTAVETGVARFKWSPDGRSIAYAAAEPKPEALKERDKKYGEFTLVDEDLGQAHLYVIEVTTRNTTRLTEGQLVVDSFNWSPDGTQIAFDHRVDSDPSNGHTSDISVVPRPVARSARWWRRRARTAIRTGRPTARASPSRHRWATRISTTPTACWPSCPQPAAPSRR
jgi:dipeptidyl aminopeptidase/acylaminoacyl peptidase